MGLKRAELRRRGRGYVHVSTSTTELGEDNHGRINPKESSHVTGPCTLENPAISLERVLSPRMTAFLEVGPTSGDIGPKEDVFARISG